MSETILIQADNTSILPGVPLTNITVASENTNIEITQQEYEVIEIAETARGVQGIQGPPGEDAHYTHDQMIAASTWTINHGLNKYPSVTIVTSGGDEVEGDINYTSLNVVTATFTSAFGGKAYLN
jgi:hypothetical protein